MTSSNKVILTSTTAYLVAQYCWPFQSANTFPGITVFQTLPANVIGNILFARLPSLDNFDV